MAKKLIPQIEKLSAESKELFGVLNEGEDLSVILVATSFLDLSLASILKRRLLDNSATVRLLDSRTGALGSFVMRADACYALGLLEKPIYKDLLKIAEIRNMIAHHHLALSFQAEDVAKLCKELGYVSSIKNASNGEPLLSVRFMDTPRNQFVLTVVMISQRLLLIGLGIKGDKLSV
jgi:DNA-binding MltR family transcriptional regulator